MDIQQCAHSEPSGSTLVFAVEFCLFQSTENAMAKLTIENLFHRELEVSDLSKSLLHHLHSHGVDWMHACGAKGRCTTCKAIVVSGLQHLNAPTAPELRYRQEGLLRENERLACQATLQGDVCIRVPELGKLPHVQYSP